MSKHTPGPWFFEGSHFWSEHGWIASSAQPDDGGDIVCNPPDADADASLARWPANARLIAAAPDLLEALRDVADQARHPDYDWPVWLSQAVSAAIAKATGE